MLKVDIEIKIYVFQDLKFDFYYRKWLFFGFNSRVILNFVFVMLKVCFRFCFGVFICIFRKFIKLGLNRGNDGKVFYYIVKQVEYIVIN